MHKILTTSLALALLATTANAAGTLYWTGGLLTDGRWSQTGNWVIWNGTAYVVPASVSIDASAEVVFNRPGASQLNFNYTQNGYTFNKLTYDTNATSAVTSSIQYSGGGRSVTMGGTTPTINVASAGNVEHVFGTDASLGHLILTDNNLTVDIDGATSTRLKIGAIIDGPGYGITKTGTGLLTLNATNTYSGATTINGGTLTLGASGLIGSSTNVTIGAWATFDVTNKTSYTMSGSQTFTFKLDGTGAGSAGLLKAKGLNITNAVVNFNIVNRLDDSVYILATYTSLTGTAFASVTVPPGYMIKYNYQGSNQIVLKSTGTLIILR
jgi:autotransporter-associated beta strand protein